MTAGNGRGLREVLLIGLAALAYGCTPSGPSSPSAEPSASASEAEAGNLPPGCEPVALLGPDGERVELDGTWTEAPGGSGMTWWIRREGSCVWGSGHVPAIEPFNPHHVQSFEGNLGDDFVIAGEILFLGPRPVGAPRNLPPHSPLRMLIDFDEAGGLVLREDREPGVAGPRCPDPTSYCPTPLVLQRAD